MSPSKRFEQEGTGSALITKISFRRIKSESLVLLPYGCGDSDSMAENFPGS